MSKLYIVKGLSKRMNKKGFLPVAYIFIILAIVGIGFLAVKGFGGLAIVTSNDFVKPDWARLECSAEDFKTTYVKYLDQQTFFMCNANTEECNFQTYDSCSGIHFQSFNVYSCSLDGSSCNYVVSNDGDRTQTLPALPSGRAYKFTRPALSLWSPDCLKVTQSYNAYKLFRYVGGSKTLVNSFDCSIQAGNLKNIRVEDYTVPVLSRQGGEGQKWINYVNDWNYGPPTNVFTYNGQQVYCTNGALYSIVKVQVKDGSIKKLDPTYKDTLPDGTILNGLGSKIKSVACCPNEPTCTSDFTFAPITSPAVTTKQCYSDLQCYNAGNPTPKTGTSYVKYQCINSACVESKPITVECTTNAQCSTGSICDLSSTNYGKCIQQKNPEYCGDGVCQATENNLLCSADCAYQCPSGEKLVIKKEYNFLSLLGITKPSETRECIKPNFWAKYGLYLMTGVAFFLVAVSWYKLRSKKLIVYIIIAFFLYLAFTYLGSGATIFFVVLAGLGFIAFTFRRQLMRLLL